MANARARTVVADRLSRAPDLDPQTLSRLAGGLAHELKNPLSTVGLHLDLLREEWQKEDHVKARRTVRTLDLLKQEVERLNDILQDFLQYARTDTIELEEADLNQLVEQVRRFVEPEARAHNVRLDVFLDLELPPFPLDKGRLRQALLNLVINSRQALAEAGGGVITIITRRADPYALLEVVDDGPGMSAETLARCFEVYYSNKKGGSGLGLPTVRRIVEAHGGHMSLESSPDHGTRATLHLPLSQAGEAGAGRPA